MYEAHILYQLRIHPRLNEIGMVVVDYKYVKSKQRPGKRHGSICV